MLRVREQVQLRARDQDQRVLLRAFRRADWAFHGLHEGRQWVVPEPFQRLRVELDLPRRRREPSEDVFFPYTLYVLVVLRGIREP